VISAFQSVDHIFVLTQGGPAGASTVLLFYLWQTRFEFLNVGAASALTIVLVAVLLIFTFTNFVLGEQKEDAYAR
jgi:sn-glycerol 3-phosphate transport system permease protein